MKCTDRKNIAAQGGWLAMATTQRGFLAFLPVILKCVFRLRSKFSPSRPGVISAKTGLSLHWKGSGNARHLLAEWFAITTFMQHLHSYKIRMLFPKGPFHTFSLPKLKEILQGVEKKNYVQKYKAFGSKAWPQCLYALFLQLLVSVMGHRAPCFVWILLSQEIAYKNHLQHLPH